MRAPAPAKINLALVVGPLARRRQARARHRLPARRHVRSDRRRRRPPSCASTASPATRSSAARSRPSQRAPASSPAGTRRSRSGSRSPPASAAAAPTRRRRCGSRTTRSASRCRGTSCTSSRRGSAPMFRSSSRRGRSSEPATARRSRRSTCRRTSGCCSSCRGTPRSPRRPRSTPRSTSATAPQGWEERRAALLDALALVRRPRDLAALPPNDLARSSITDELLALGAFRADVSGAGPTVYGLFHHKPAAEAAKRALKRPGGTWITPPAWYG